MPISWDLFKRLRFFDGFFTRAKDWASEQQYHIEKRRLHNLFSHHHGVVSGLQVSPAVEHGPFSVKIIPGMAIDGLGREIILNETFFYVIPEDMVKRLLSLKKKKLYIGIRYQEKSADTQVSSAYPQYQQPTRIEEVFEISAYEEKPVESDVVELCEAGIKENGITGIRDEGIKMTGPGVQGLVKERSNIQQGEKHLEPGNREESLWIGEKPINSPSRFCLIDVFPKTPELVIRWSVQVTIKNDIVSYYLIIENIEKKEGKVGYRVYWIE
ncbi:MAG: hypothetical protein ACMUIU_13195 [bacterium]